MKILMVCLGNICRSPMAEGIMREKIKKYKLNAEVDSCGTANYHVGQAPDMRAIQTLKKYDIDISQHKGRQFRLTDFDNFDLIFVMDNQNYADIISKARNKTDKMKVRLLMDEMYPEQKKIVPDPYFGGIEGFEETYALINETCKHIVSRLAK